MAPNPRFPSWPANFDPFRAYRPLLEAKELRFDAVRLWLCENSEGILLENGEIVGVHPKLLEAVKVLQECAALAGLRLYWSLLDGNGWAREKDPTTRAVLSQKDAADRFAERVVAPLVRSFDSSVLFGVDLVNEPEVNTADCVRDGSIETIAWENIGYALRVGAQAALAERPGALVTAGVNHVFAPMLWKTNPQLTALDLHVYHTNGGLPDRAQLARELEDERLRDGTLPLLAGECGIPKDPGPEEEFALRNYLFNAESCGYQAVFLWQLQGDLLDPKHPKRRYSTLGENISKTIGRIRETSAEEAPSTSLREVNLSIVIPAFNEEGRVGTTLQAVRRFLDERTDTLAEVLVVDDGSTDDTRMVVEAQQRVDSRIRLLSLSKNAGKGAAVRTGVLEAKGARVLFMDADLATPLEELEKLEAALAQGADVVIGTRASDASVIETRQHPAREYLGKSFNVLVRALFGITLKDTQCGFKLFTREAAHALFMTASVDRFAFDVELLLRAQGRYRVAEVPVRWRHVERSSVSMLRDAPMMALDLLGLRWKYSLRRSS